MADQPLLNFEEAALFVETGELSEETYNRLYEHFCSIGEMPYGTMKARDGDPYQWIADRLEQDYG